ncbi:MAG TPA: glycosyltransferase [Gemmataceae bacterium]|jgi:glycosyltransferase involved in cell wall biosynthesis
MRILTVTNLYPNPFQPQRATFNREQVKALAREHEVSVISPIAWTDELAARRRGAPALPRNRMMEWDGVPVKYPRSLFTPRILRRLYGHFYFFSIRKTLLREIESFRPDVLFATWAYPDGWAAVKIGRQANLPVVLKVHGSDIRQLEESRGRLNGTIQALRGADRVVAVSRDLAMKVAELGAEPSRVHLVYNGVDVGRFCPGDRAAARQRLGLPAGRTLLLYVGNLFPVKGPDVLLQACVALAKRGIEFDLHFVGQGKLRQELENQSRVGSIQDRVLFQGSIAHDRLPDWFRAADLLVLPSHSEGVPNVLLEAAACGTPFVASDVGGVPEISHLGPSRLVPAGDVEKLASAVAMQLAAPRGKPTSGGVGRSHEEAARELTAVFQMAVDDPNFAHRARNVHVAAA